MASISRFLLWGHLRAEPNQYILHYEDGEVVRRGVGQAYWFSALSASIAQVPAEDVETTFVLNERSADFQDVTVQVTIIYRFVDPEKAAERVNFAISPRTGSWLETPLERLANFWSQRAQQPARAYLLGVPLVDAVREGPEAIRDAIREAVQTDEELEAMGLGLVGVQVNQVAPTAELEKALQTPTLEEIQQKADEATFRRRAQAVEKERAIKENEMATELELARREEELIQQRGENRLLEIERESEAERALVEAEVERQEKRAEGMAVEERIRSEADAVARRMIGAARADAEAARLEAWADAPSRVALVLGASEAAENIGSIQHLNLTPDLLAQTVERYFTDGAEPAPPREE